MTPFAGQSVYIELLDGENGGTGWVGIDDVRLTGDFTVSASSAVPEPSTIVMAAFGMVALGFYGWRRRVL